MKKVAGMLMVGLLCAQTAQGAIFNRSGTSYKVKDGTNTVQNSSIDATGNPTTGHQSKKHHRKHHGKSHSKHHQHRHHYHHHHHHHHHYYQNPYHGHHYPKRYGPRTATTYSEFRAMRQGQDYGQRAYEDYSRYNRKDSGTLPAHQPKIHMWDRQEYPRDMGPDRR